MKGHHPSLSCFDVGGLKLCQIKLTTDCGGIRIMGKEEERVRPLHLSGRGTGQEYEFQQSAVCTFPESPYSMHDQIINTASHGSSDFFSPDLEAGNIHFHLAIIIPTRLLVFLVFRILVPQQKDIVRELNYIPHR